MIFLFEQTDVLVDAFAQVRAQMSNALLLLVPRHPERFARVTALCEKRGLSFVLRSSRLPCQPDTAVFLGDSMGGAVVTQAAGNCPERIASLTMLSRPHPASFARALKIDPEQPHRSRHHQELLDPDAGQKLLAENGKKEMP